MKLMIKKILRQFGYIHTSELIKQAVDIYAEHSKSHKDEKEFYYNCGNCNALNSLFSSLGINLRECVKCRNTKRKYARWTE